MKLLRREPETDALIEAIGPVTSRVSSELLEVELHCVAHRLDDDLQRRVDPVLATIDLLPYTPPVRARAGRAFEPPQRALDAIHLATALDLALDGLVLLTYDRGQAAAGDAAGLRVEAPA